jgi:succinate-acetate transporter protein
VIWAAIFFGGIAQLVAGLQEVRTGNNFGYAVFCTYGAFWMALAGMLWFGKTMGISGTDTGWFLVMFTLFTAIFFIGAMKQHSVLALIFLTLLLGFIGLDISHLGGPAIFTKIAAWDLIICALLAWYLMAHVAFEGIGWKLSVGKPWLK